MKQETATSADRLRVVLQLYALALLLAMFISALHAGILFSLGDFLRLLHHWARPTLGEGRPTDILVLLTAISFLFVARTWRRPRCGQPFFGSRVTWPRSAKAGISPVFRTRRSVTVMSYSRNRGKSLGPICAINGLLTFGCSTATLFLVLQMVWHHRL